MEGPELVCRSNSSPRRQSLRLNHRHHNDTVTTRCQSFHDNPQHVISTKKNLHNCDSNLVPLLLGLALFNLAAGISLIVSDALSFPLSRSYISTSISWWS